MKLKEINRTAIQSWSPAEHHPIYLATGTSAQQLDASFSTNACLEFFELDLAEPSVDMKLCGSFSSTHRYHKLVWGPSEINDDGHPAGVLTAGGENGNVILYNPAKIIAGESDVIIAESNRHSGPVRALDINPFQTNLVASGGNESEIYIWDMNNFDSPMTPGPKTQPLEDISCISWNRQVQHILASASPSGRASVWDLRKNDLIIKVSDHSNRMHCSGLAWNPEVATQLVLASEDDRMPVIQMWDLRFATSPLKIFENHTRGILSIAWNLADPELLLSCGKDSRILCWNPNTAEVLYELPTSNQWCFDIQWCPRNPAVLSAAGFDGHIDIYSIMGGSSQAQSQRHADQISTSFGNMDPFGTGQTLPPMQLPQTSIPAALVNPLKKPPKWIRRPVGASFAFGGKLVSLENGKPNPQQPEQPISYTVHISQVVTETALLKRSDQLQATLTAGSILDFCQGKIVAAENESEKTIWSFLKVNFESEIRCKFLELLGYNKEELALKISAALEAKTADPPKVAMPAAVSLQPLPDLSLLPLADTPEAAFDMIAASNQPAATLELDSLPAGESETPAVKAVDPDNDLLTSEPEESGDQILSEGEAEEEIPLEETSAPMEEEPSPAKTSVPTEEATTAGGFSLNISEDVDGLITQALLTGDFEGAVDLCLHDNRMADSIILAIAGGAELMEKTQKKYFTKTHSKITKLISAVVMKDLRDILKTCDLQNWKEALAAVMTYAKPDEFSPLCDLLGGRLETSEFTELQYQACLCYICSGNVEKLVTCLSKALEKHSPLSLQNLVEKVVVLHRAVEQTRRSCPSAVNIILAKLMSQYATLLASQGSLSSALAYLPDNTNQIATQNLHDRLSCALRQQEMAPIGNQRAQSQLPAYQAKHNSGMPCCPITAVQLTMMPQPNAAAPGPMFTPPSAPAPAQLQYYQPVRAASTVTSWSNQTPTALPNVPPSLQVGSASDQQVEPSNSMYMMPTSATSVAPAIPSTPAYMYSQQYQPYPQVNQYPPGAMGSAFYQPLQHSYSPAETTSTSRLPGFLPQYTQPTLFQPAPPFYPGQPPISHCQSFSSPSHPPFFATVASSSAPLSSKASFQHGGPGSPVSYMPLPPPCEVSGTQHDPDPELTLTTQITGPQNGWNDPPALNRASKKKVPENYSPPVPITAPIMGPLSADGQCSGAPPTMFQGPHGTQSLYSGMQQQQISPLTMNSTIPKTSMEGAPGAPTGDVIQPLQAIPPEKIMKKPIPDEHIILKTTFEGLIQKCLSVATDPQTKRKLDEANKRLEALYDKLREQTLSPAIVGGLHNIATTIEARSYIEGLTIHTRIVSNSNFSETSAFMPVLKVVLTQANKLGV